MTTSGAERLTTESYKKLMSPKTESFKVIEVSLTTNMIDEDGIRNTISHDCATLAPSANIVGCQKYTPNEQVDKQEGQNTTEEPSDVPWEYAADCIVRHIGEFDNVRYIVRWQSYTPADDTVEHLSTSRNTSLLAIGGECRRMLQCNKNMGNQMSTGDQGRQSRRLWFEGSNVEDKVSNNRQWLARRQ